MRPRACKIVATLGPASDPPERLMMLIKAGVNCFRLNFSHGDRPDHARRVASIREAEARVGYPIAIMADMQGPKIRVGRFPEGGIKLRYGDIVTLEASTEMGGDGLIRMPHPEVVHSLETGDVIRLDDGRLMLTVVSRSGDGVQARVEVGGELKNQKGVNVPSRRIPISALTEKDREDLVFALDQGQGSRWRQRQCRFRVVKHIGPCGLVLGSKPRGLGEFWVPCCDPVRLATATA